jgi:hypothetical protein
MEALGDGFDFVDMYKAMEAIERHHGWPARAKNREQRQKRETIAAKLGSTVEQWQAINRSARPRRHLYPDDMEGPKYTPFQARNAIRQMLMWWLEVEMPD